MDILESKSSFRLDEPIKGKSQDLLGMASSAASLAQYCLSQDESSSYVIGIYGEWGSGKTSFVSLVKEHLIEMTKGMPDSKKPTLFTFDPWACDPSEPMLRRFLSELTASLSKGSSKVRDAKAIASKLRAYADAAAPMTPIPGAMGVASAALGSFAESGATVSSLKRGVGKKFQKLEKRVFVFIDDLDRLPDEQIRAVFQLVNHTASFSNMVYILAFDHDVVAAALDKTQFGAGADYIRKIIQVEYSVPRFSRVTIMNYLLEQVEPYFETAPMRDFDRARFYQIQNVILAPVLRSLREAKRVINTFAVNCATVSRELNLTDLLALSAIEVADPALYSWIHENKELVCLPDYGSALRKDYSSEFDERVRTSLSDLYNGRQHSISEALDKLELLFPKVSTHGRGSDSKVSRTYRRISSPAYFDLYFSNNADSAVVPRADIESLIDLNDEDTAKAILVRAAESKRLTELLEEMACHERHFTPAVSEMLVRPLFSMLGKSSEESRSILSLDADTRIRFMLTGILGKMGTQTAGLLVESLVVDLDGDNLIGLSAWINDFELAYGRLAATGEDPSGQVISLEVLENVERTFVENASDYAYDGALLRHRRAGSFLYLWHALDEEGFKAFWEAAFSRSDLFYAYLVLACSGEWTSGTARGWRCDDEFFGGLVSRGQIVPRLLNLKGDDALAEFTDEELCKLISFVEGGSDADMNRYYSEDNALQHVSEWRERQNRRVFTG